MSSAKADLAPHRKQSTFIFTCKHSRSTTSGRRRPWLSCSSPSFSRWHWCCCTSASEPSGHEPMTSIALPQSALAGRARVRRKLRKIGFALSVVIIVSPAILVFVWMLSLSLKNEIDNLTYPPVFIPSPPTLANFIQVFSENAMGLYIWNSVIVSGLATLIALAVGIPAGYGIARANALKLTVLIMIARMTPALSYLIPLFTV